MDILKDNKLSHNDMWDDSLLIAQYDTAMQQIKQKVSQRINEDMQKTSKVNPQSSDAQDEQFSDARSSCSSHKPNKNKRKNKKQFEWRVGAACRCHYEEDELYEATVTELHPDQLSATVIYIGYDNTETVKVSELFRTKGAAARKQQYREAMEFFDDEEEADGNVDEDAEGSVGDASSSAGRRYTEGVAGRWKTVHHISDASTSSSASEQQQQRRHNEGAADKGFASTMPHLPPPPPPLGLCDSGLSNEALHTMLMSWYMTGYHTGYYKGVTAAKNSTSKSSSQKKRHHHHHPF